METLRFICEKYIKENTQSNDYDYDCDIKENIEL